MNIIYKTKKNICEKQLLELFINTEWEYEAQHPDIVSKAISLSTNVITAWDDNKLVGIIRSMDDGIWSANIDCLVVHKDYRGIGIGSKLLKTLLDNLKSVVFINVAPNETSNVQFYIKNGFKLISEGHLLQIDRS